MMRIAVGKSQQSITKRADDLNWLNTELQGSFEEHFYRKIPFFVALNIGNKNPQKLKISSLFSLFLFPSIPTSYLLLKK